MSDQLVKVHDVSQEYWYIGQNPCSCGGRLEREMQALEQRDGKPVDYLMTRCNMCGKSREFLFDISAFHGLLKDMMRLSDISKSIADERLKTKVLNAAGSPVSKAVLAIHMAADADDRLALDWLEDAIRYAWTKLATD
jgi:hypothetical protein